MAKFFNTLNLFSSESEPEQELQKLKSLDLGGFAEYMKSAKKIVFMSGAGISTSAGIPDFRSPKTGLYANLQKYELPDPHLIFDLRYFKVRKLVFNLHEIKTFFYSDYILNVLN
jgi:NAD-dependent deacetylase sirtuin 2